jgi:hypothetical protein
MAASAFAAAYARFLDGADAASALPDTTRAVRAVASRAGAVPADRRRGPLVITQLQRADQLRNSYFLAARDRAHTFYAQLTLGRRRHGRWLVVQLTPPDFMQALAPAGPPGPAPPRGSRDAEVIAQRFLATYLPWLYGHASLTLMMPATPRVLARLERHPTGVPPAMRSLHGRVVAIAMRRDGGHWRALANVTDDHETYELVLAVTHMRGRWLVTDVGNPR